MTGLESESGAKGKNRRSDWEYLASATFDGTDDTANWTTRAPSRTRDILGRL